MPLDENHTTSVLSVILTAASGTVVQLHRPLSIGKVLGKAIWKSTKSSNSMHFNPKWKIKKSGEDWPGG